MGPTRSRNPAPAALADLLREILRSKPAGKRLREGKIWDVWEEAVGKQIASRARPVKVSDGLLTVAVATSPWMQQLTFLKREICDKINILAGEELVRDLYLKAGKVETERREKPPKMKSRRLTADEDAFVTREASAVADPEVREALRRLMSRYMANRLP
jgi:predicted nucleic acid-binding Zn ribbon protein